MYRKHPNHTYRRNRNNSANNQAYVLKKPPGKNVFVFQKVGLYKPRVIMARLWYIIIFPSFNSVSHTSVKSNEKIPMFHFGFGKSLTFIKAFSEESFMFTAHSAHFQATCSSSRYLQRFFVRVGHENT